MVRMYEDEPFVEKFFQIVLDYQKKLIRRYYASLGPYIDYTSSGDDFATQSSLFPLAAMFPDPDRAVHQGAHPLHEAVHGRAVPAPLLRDEVPRPEPGADRCGVDILIIQPCARHGAGSRCAPRLAGRSRSTAAGTRRRGLPRRHAETVARAVDRLLNGIEAQKGGYVFAAAHNLQGDVPPENIAAMFRAARNWKPNEI